LPPASKIAPDLPLKKLIGHHSDGEFTIHIPAGLAAEHMRVVLGLEENHPAREARRMLGIGAKRKGMIGEMTHAVVTSSTVASVFTFLAQLTEQTAQGTLSPDESTR
jgi:hypothetical protein